MFEFSGTLTWKDSLHIYWLSIRPRPAWAAVGVLLLLLALFLLGMEWRDFLNGGRAPGVLSYSLLVLTLLFFVYYPWQHYRAFKKSTRLSRPITFRFEPGQIIASEEMSTHRIPWSEITSVRESRHAYLLLDPVEARLGIPKRMASEQQRGRLAEYIRTRGVVV
jgi:hypothetical protein